VNNYLSCIEVPNTRIAIPFCAPAQFMNSYGTNYNPFAQNYDPTMNNQMYGSNAYTQTSANYYSGPQYSNIYNNMGIFNPNFPSNNYMESMPGYASQANTGMRTGQFGCQAAQIQVKNSCYEPIDLRFDSLGGGVIISSGQELSLKKGESKTITAQGGQVLGQYNISMSAKPSDDTIEEYTFVKDIPVIVSRPIEVLPEDCIIVPKTSFEFTYTTDKQKLTVINNCVDAGYSLLSLRINNPEDLVVGEVQYFSIGDVNATLRPKKTTRYEQGKAIEIMTIDVRRNPDIVTKMLRTDNTTAAKTITNFRKDYFDLGQSINVTVLLSILYSTPRLKTDEKVEELLFIDKLQWLGYLDGNTTDTNQPTDTNQTPQTPVTPPSVEDRITTEYTTTNTRRIDAASALEFVEFSLNDNSQAKGILIKIKDEYTDDVSDFFNNETDARVCFVDGKVFDFKRVNPTGFNKLTERSFVEGGNGRIQNGEVISEIHFLNNGKTYEICLSRPLTPLSAADARIDRAVYRDETDSTKEKIFSIKDSRASILRADEIYKVKFALSARLGTFGYVENTTAPEYLVDSARLQDGECLDPKGFEKFGLTGKSYTEYGFNRLLFVWNPEEISYNVFDYGQVFADQDQLRIALSKKMDYLANNHFIELEGIKFLKTTDNKIARSEILLDKNPIEKTVMEGLINSNSFTSGADAKAQITTLRQILSGVPEDLRKYTIIEIAIPVGSVENSVNLDATKINAMITRTTDNNLHKPEANKYQFTVYTFLNKTNNLSTELETMNDADNKNWAEFLKRFLNSMNLYYGDALTPVIVNLKTYGNLETGITKDILSGPEFMQNFWSFNIKSDSSIKQISTPGAYKLNLEITDKITKKANYSLSSVTSFNYYNNPKYRTNLFFTNPLNAFYFNYGGVPFRTGEAGTRKETELIKNYSNWSKVQDGYILSFKSTNNTISNVIFKDIRPLQVISNVANDYRLEYLSQDKYNTLTEDMDWRLSTDTDKLVKQNTRYVGPTPTNGYLLLNHNNKPTVFRSTIFVFNNLQDSSRLEHQLRMYSRNDFKFNLTPQKIPLVNVGDNKAFAYGVPKNLSSLAGYSNVLGADTSTVNKIVTGIESENMCFNFTDGFNIWFNPDKGKTVVEVQNTNPNPQLNTTPPQQSNTPQLPQTTPPPQTNAPNPNPTPPQNNQSAQTSNVVNLTINNGTFTVDSSATSSTTVNVIGDNLVMDLQNNKLHGTIRFASGSQNATVNITEGTAVISGNNVTLNINGRASAGIIGSVRVTTQGTLNTTGATPNLNGTYNITANQSVTVNGVELNLTNINFIKQ